MKIPKTERIIESEPDLIYCNNCKYFQKDTRKWKEHCKHRSALKDTYKLKSREIVEYPKDKNEDNQCKDYKRKWWKL